MASTMLSAATEARNFDRLTLLTCEVHELDSRTVVFLRGEGDVSTGPLLCDALARVIADGGSEVLIDLAGVPFIDVATGRILATARQLLEQNGRRLRLRSPSRTAQKVLQLFGITELIEAEEPNAPRHDPCRTGGTEMTLEII